MNVIDSLVVSLNLDPSKFTDAGDEIGALVFVNPYATWKRMAQT